ncbi:MAG: dTMP kinase [Candidatus Eisenbacteria bacterium]
MFVTFEGVEGCGKTTQAALLKENLEKEGRRVVFSREPGGTEVGERIREILLDRRLKGMEPLAELFLYLASRAQHVKELIGPALKEGAIVVCDRYADAGVAYQGAARGIGVSQVLLLNRWATFGVVPDYTVLIDLPVETGLKRKVHGAGGIAERDRIEQEKPEFHAKVREAYLELARESSNRVEIFDGSLPESRLAADILTRVNTILGSRK